MEGAVNDFPKTQTCMRCNAITGDLRKWQIVQRAERATGAVLGDWETWCDDCMRTHCKPILEWYGKGEPPKWLADYSERLFGHARVGLDATTP